MNEHEEVQTGPKGKSEDTAQEVTIEPEAHAAEATAERGADGKLVPVSEARRYRKRAQAAETILGDLRTELAEKSTQLNEQAETIESLRRQRDIDELLVEASAIDLETARLLTELALHEMDKPDVAQAVEEIRQQKPFLFRHAAGGTGALSPKEAGFSPSAERLQRAAAEACVTGHRQDVLRYLRLRRKK